MEVCFILSILIATTGAAMVDVLRNVRQVITQKDNGFGVYESYPRFSYVIVPRQSEVNNGQDSNHMLDRQTSYRAFSPRTTLNNRQIVSEQFLKEVVPTTRTALEEQQKAKLPIQFTRTINSPSFEEEREQVQDEVQQPQQEQQEVDAEDRNEPVQFPYVQNLPDSSQHFFYLQNHPVQLPHRQQVESQGYQSNKGIQFIPTNLNKYRKTALGTVPRKIQLQTYPKMEEAYNEDELEQPPTQLISPNKFVQYSKTDVEPEHAPLHYKKLPLLTRT